MYKFKLPIGDWSRDGHNECDYYIIESNISAKELIPIYNEMDKVFNLSKECYDYEVNMLSEEFIELLKSKDIDPEKYCLTDENYRIDDPRDMAELVIDLLMYFEEKLELKIVLDDIPMFNNWLAQEINESLKLPGYGLWQE